MAIYSLHTKVISRAKSASVVASAAYRHAACFKDNRTEIVHDYTKKQGCIYNELSFPITDFSWIHDLEKLNRLNPDLASEQLWNAVESVEKRKDAQLAREIRIALPIELRATQNIELVRAYVKSQFVSHGMIADWSIHFDVGNPHVHILLTFRELTVSGFGQKVREWNHHDMLNGWREQFAISANHHLAKHGMDARIDHRSYAEQGIDLIPTKHLGKSVVEQEKRGIVTERMELHRDILAENLTRIAQNPDILLDAITAQSATFTAEKTLQVMARYMNPHNGESNTLTAEALANNATQYAADVKKIHDNKKASLPHSRDEYASLNDTEYHNISTDNTLNNPALSAESRNLNQPSYPSKNPAEYLSSSTPYLSEESLTNAPAHQSHSVLNQSTLEAIDAQEPSIKPLEPAFFDKLLSAIEKHDSAFSDEHVAKALFKLNPHMDAPLFTQVLTQVKAHLRDATQVLSLGIGDNGRETFTTKKLFDVENKVQHLTEKLLKSQKPVIKKSTIKKALAMHAKVTGKTLTHEQHYALMRLIKPSGLSCLVGRAGTGKSFTMGALRTIYEASGFDVQGVALSGVATDGLSMDAGIQSRTIASFAKAYKEKKLKLSDKSVIVMDEAGMTDSQSMLAVLKAADKTGAKLILLGDPEQLQPVGPGAVFRAILERLGKRERATLDKIYRQVDAWQKKASLDFANGEVEKAMNAYDEKGCIHIDKTENDAMNRLVSDWKKRWLLDQNLSEQIVMTLKNDDVQMINGRLRQMLVDEGYLSEGYSVTTVTASDTGKEISSIKKIAQGDRLVFLKNDYDLGVKNGRFATVTKVYFLESGQVTRFTVRLDGSDKDITINPKKYKAFDHGYAATIHKSQGITRDHGFIYVANHAWDRAMAYVAMTRHRLSAHLYTSQTLFPTLSHLVKTFNQLPIKDSILHYPLFFARRRGIEPNTARIKSHLFQRLSNIKAKITHEYKRFKDPFGYACDIMAERAAENRETARQNAVIVAQYKDISHQTGKLWGEMLTQLTARGFKQNTLEFNEAQKLLPEYAARDALIAQRDKLASEIDANKEMYQLAMNLNRVDDNKLKKEALTHAIRVRLQSYLTAKDKQTFMAQKIAADLNPVIKKYYGVFKSLNVNLSELNQSAKSYHQRIAREPLSQKEREAFDRVAAYQNCLTQSTPLLSKSNEYYHAEKHPEACLVLQEKLIVLGRQKSAIADKILSDRETHSKGLDYFEIGRGIDFKRAQKRWVSLQQAAYFHALSRDVSPTVSQATTPVSLKPIQPLLPVKSIPQKPHNRIDLQRLKADLNAQVETVVTHYLGEPKKRRANQWQYGIKKGSLFVTTQGAKQGSWYDFQTGTGGDMLSLIQHYTTGDFKTTLNEAFDFLGGQSHYLENFQETPEQIALREKRQLEALRIAESENAKKLAHVQTIAKGTLPIAGTLAEKYLSEHRGIHGQLNSDNLRFHPALKNWSNGQTYPALVVLAHDADQRLTGLQATFLDPLTACKATMEQGNNKLSRGQIGFGSTVHHAISENPHPTIALAEGLETALSVAEAHPDWEVKLTFGVSNVEKVAIASGQQSLVICADNDGLDSGTAKSVKKAVENLATQGIAAVVVEPTKPQGIEKWDFNDALKKSGIESIRADLDQTHLFVQHSEKVKTELAPEIEKEITKKSLPQALIDYIEAELKQTSLVNAHYDARSGTDPEKALIARNAAFDNLKKLQTMAQELLKNPTVESLLHEAQQTYLSAEKMDLPAIKNHIEQGGMELPTVYPLLKSFRQKASALSMSQKQSQGQHR